MLEITIRLQPWMLWIIGAALGIGCASAVIETIMSMKILALKRKKGSDREWKTMTVAEQMKSLLKANDIIVPPTGYMAKEYEKAMRRKEK